MKPVGSGSPRFRRTSDSPRFNVPDLPIPTPPPMANLMMTSRFDLQTRGGYNYRRILNSASTEFGRSPILGRTSAFRSIEDSYCTPRQSNSGCTLPNRTFGSASEHLGRSPILRHKNYEDLSRSIDFEFLEPQYAYTAPRQFESAFRPLSSSSKYLSKDSVLSQELEEVKNLSRELNCKFCDPVFDDPKYSEQPNVFYNDHYMSDIDENEEVTQFCYGYEQPARRHSDTDRTANTEKLSVSYNTLPSIKYARTHCEQFGSPVHKQEVLRGSFSSFKSSDYGVSPGAIDGAAPPPKIMKSPHRTIVKIAKIRLV